MGNLTEVLGSALAAALLALVTQGLRLLSQRLRVSRNELARLVAAAAVRAAEEIGAQAGASGEEKLVLAGRVFSDLADANKVRVKSELVRDYLHAELPAMRAELEGVTFTEGEGEAA